MKTWLISVSVATALIAGGVQAQTTGEAAAGESRVAVCLACHGPNGNSLVPMFPKLAGQHPEYLAKQMADFKSGARKNDQMTPQAALINEGDIPDIAAYYSSQQQTAGTADPALKEQGQTIYRAGNPASGVPACSGCHGPAGLGMGAAKFPRIAGQQAQYVDTTLKSFRAGTRANDPNGMMQGVAGRMSDAEIAAVSQYVQGLAQQ